MMPRSLGPLDQPVQARRPPHSTDYQLVLIRLGGALGVCSAGEITNVSHTFQPSGRFWFSNSL